MSAGSDKELNDLERSLTRLVPLDTRLDRDHLFFAAGRASLSRVRRRLLGFVAALCGVCVGLGYLLWTRPVIVGTERVVTVHTPPAPPPVEVVPEEEPRVGPAQPPVADDMPTPGPSGYGRIHRDIARLGEYALPPLPAEPDGAPVHPDPTRLGSRPAMLDSFFRWR